MNSCLIALACMAAPPLGDRQTLEMDEHIPGKWGHAISTGGGGTWGRRTCCIAPLLQFLGGEPTCVLQHVSDINVTIRIVVEQQVV